MTRELLMEYVDSGKFIDAAVYLRKSRAEEHMSLEDTLSRHKSALLAYADRHRYRVIDIYEEVVSGESLFARPQMLKLMEAVSAGKYHAVLCMDMQRLGRGGMYDQGFILDTFKESETLIVTPERLYDLTKEIDEQAAEMETFLSRGEYRLITKRLSRGKMQSVENGAYMANPPFGYRKIRLGRLPSLEIVPEEGPALQLNNVKNLAAESFTCPSGLPTALQVTGSRNRAITIHAEEITAANSLLSDGSESEVTIE